MTAPTPEATVLYDGVCGLCNALIRFVAAQDPAGRVAFRPLDPPPGEDGTIVLLAYGRRYERSDAVLYLTLSLRAPWPLAFAAIVVPRRWRDALYRWVAQHRHGWFGR